MDENKGIHVWATCEISVIGYNSQQNSQDAYLALPLDVLGKEYYVMTWEGNPQILVIATRDNTVVTITLPTSTKGAASNVIQFTYQTQVYRAGSTLRVTLQKFETFHIMQQDQVDLTGSRVTANHPISVITGNDKASAVENVDGRSFLVEMMYPLQSWGQSFVLFNTTTIRRDGVWYKLLASEDSTKVTVVPALSGYARWSPALLQAGQSMVCFHKALQA
nr:hypothetical protein BaRGS_021853 [Batillaria attramentaria]